MASLSMPANPADAAMPFDIRLMNGVASSLFVLVAVALCVAGLMWLARAPWLTIRVIQLEGDLQRSNVATLRANAAEVFKAMAAGTVKPAIGARFGLHEAAALHHAAQDRRFTGAAVMLP